MAIRRKLIAGIASLLTFVFNGVVQAASDLNMRPGVTETSNEAFNLHMMVVWVMVAISVVVFGAMIYSFIFHRKSKHPTPAKFSHSTLVEMIWTIIPILILIYLTIPAVKLLIKMEDASNPEMSIQVTGSQWKWHYKYLEHDVDFFSNLDRSLTEKDENYLLEVDNALIIPADTKVRFLVTASDVIHSWWVPDLAVKKDAIPGFINETWTSIPAEHAGKTFRGQCTELCGKDHGFMPVVVKVLSKADFKAWLAQKDEERIAAEKAAAEAAAQSWDMEKLMTLGKEVYDAKCGMCHQANGLGLPPAFPALKDSPIALGPVEAHIDIVVNGKSGTGMAAYGPQLTDAELAAVITYERNAWENNTGDKVQPADIQAFKAGN
ncbi:MAG: cytochrome c oxidase subunit II [Kangiellaceae bacterium]|jgi:cytochrome c oxidase subunit 2